MGIEPMTSCLLDRCSNQRSYSANYEFIKKLLCYDLFSALSCYLLIKMFNRHILALKMNYNVFTRFEKLQKPNWDWVYKIIKNSKTYKSYINFNHSF